MGDSPAGSPADGAASDGRPDVSPRERRGVRDHAQPVATGALAGMEPLRADVTLSPGAVSLTLTATALFGIPVDCPRCSSMATATRWPTTLAFVRSSRWRFTTRSMMRAGAGLSTSRAASRCLANVYRVADDDTSVRLSLAAGLVNSLELAKASAPNTVEAHLAEVRAIHRAAPSDPEVAVQLAMGLLSHALWANSPERPASHCSPWSTNCGLCIELPLPTRPCARSSRSPSAGRFNARRSRPTSATACSRNSDSFTVELPVDGFERHSASV